MSNKEAKTEKIIASAQQLSMFVLLVALFLGTLYMFNGSLLFAIPTSVILVAGMYYIVGYMVGAKMGKKRSGFSFGDRMLWLLYAVISIPVTFIVLHAFNVEIQEKQTIEQQGIKKVKALSDLKREYENTYKNYLSQTERNMNHFIPIYLLGVLTPDELKKRINVNDAFINGMDPSYPTASVRSYINIEQMKFQRADTSLFGETQKYIDLQEGKIRNFSRLSINFVLTDLDEKLKLSKKSLNDYLFENADGKDIKFNIKPYTTPTLIAQPLTLLQKQMNPLLFVIILLIHGLLLLPYFMAPAKTYEGSRKPKSKKPDGVSEDVVVW